MPNATAAPQIPHSGQHLNYNPMAQNQYNLAQPRAMPNNQHIPSHMVNGGAQAGGMPQGHQLQPSQDQPGHATQMMSQYPPVFGYAQMGIHNYARLPPGYGWPMGRGASVNGQHQMPGIPPNGGHPQQMLNVGKAVPGGMQGR